MGYFISGGSTDTTNKIVLSAGTANVANQGIFFGTSSYAYYDPTGYIRAVNYATDTGAVTTAGTTSLPSTAYVQATGPITAQTTATFTDLNLVGNSSVTLASGTLGVSGVLQTAGGSSTISGGSGIQPASGANLSSAPISRAMRCTISTPILANGSNALTKLGPGTLDAWRREHLHRRHVPRWRRA